MAGPTTLSNAEIDRYSVVFAIQSGLDSLGWSVPVDQVTDRWPSAEEINPPSVWVMMDFHRTVVPELGTHGKERETFIHVYATNDSERDRLAETICDLVRDIIPIYDWQDGNETNPSITQYFSTEGQVEFRPIRAITTAPKEEQFRAVVQATLLRQDA